MRLKAATAEGAEGAEDVVVVDRVLINTEHIADLDRRQETSIPSRRMVVTYL